MNAFRNKMFDHRHPPVGQINKDDVSEGFTALWERGRLDLTVEAVVLTDPWRTLFSDSELETARKRLQDLGYQPAQAAR